MSDVTYHSEALYIQSKTGLKAKIAAINALIDQMFLSAAKGANTANLEEYMMDTGQTKVKTLYRDPKSIMAGIAIFETQKNY